MATARAFDTTPRHASLKRSGALVAALLLIVMVLGVAVRASGGTTGVDEVFAAAVWRLRQPWLDEAAMALSGFGDGLPRWCVTALVSAYLVMTRRRGWAFALVAAMGACALLAPAFKLAFHTPRPSPLYTGVDAFSFPSGHAVSAAALYVMLGALAAEGLTTAWRRLAVGLAAGMVLSISLSRVYLGAHWLSDVVAGAALGGAIAIAAIALARRAQAGRSLAEGRDSLAIVICLAIVAAGTGPIVVAKAHRLYAPFLSRTVTPPPPP
ncbi:phosphatase PAP2 family protein [Caulobacter sp. 1776]|uniref:phosphatase PAP2 family protein n=1 Tax=Caulobacter sp. 1776 TaxID=3156420 RepID=UPI0033941681